MGVGKEGGGRRSESGLHGDMSVFQSAFGNIPKSANICEEKVSRNVYCAHLESFVTSSHLGKPQALLSFLQ